MEIKVKWLDNTPVYGTGVTWGVPWKEGSLLREEKLSLRDAKGQAVRMQTRPTAFWPGGSVKWTAHSASFTGDIQEHYIIKKSPAETDSAEQPLKIIHKEDSIEVDTGRHTYIAGKSGIGMIRAIISGGKILCSGSRLVCMREERNKTPAGRIYKEEDSSGNIENVIVEQEGPVLCVIRTEGKHRLPGAGRQWIPFIIRMYFYAGQDSVRMVCTSFYDGDPHKDYVKGLGIEFTLPMKGELYNRHIRLGGDTGFFCDSPKNLDLWRSKSKYKNMAAQQINGTFLRFDCVQDAAFLNLLDGSAVWNDFKIFQDSSDVFTIYKRTGQGCSWLKAAQGKRSMGLAYAGSENGGVAVGVKDFWQKHPSAYELSDMAAENGKLTVWLWPPDSGAMDLRHYDKKAHMLSAYEGFQEMRSTPYGIANTNEITIKCFSEPPRHEILAAAAEQARSHSMLVCEPGYYHGTKVFGIWSLKDESTPVRARLEKELDDGYQFMMEQMEQWKWYGFWNYGDIMRAYDPVRHVWRYDVGGFAWNNNEFDPNIWLWYMFLRSGRGDIFRTAEAFTRHACEVDQYHFGEYAGLGSRHNVMHWGCGCKEARISMAALHRFYYYLTADERTGDILEEVRDADYITVNLDPMRACFSEGEFPTHTRAAPDWAAFCSNWLARWERFEDESYKNKILKGMECIGKAPHQLCSGPVYGYEPETGMLFHIGDENYSFHMMNCFGSTVVWMELAGLLGNERWKRMLADYGRFYLLEEKDKLKNRPDMKNCSNWGLADTALSFAAYAAALQGDRQLAEKVWDCILSGYTEKKAIVSTGYSNKRLHVTSLACPKELDEITRANSGMALRYLFIIQCLELIGGWIPENQP